MAIGPKLISVIPNEGAVITNNQVLTIQPRQLTFRFDDGQVIDPATVGGITLVGAGGDNIFGNANDVKIVPGFIGVNDAPNQNEVVMRFAQSLPKDVYQIKIAGAGATALKNAGGQAFNGGVNFSETFTLDLGPQVIAVVPQPVSRDAFGKLSQAANEVDVYFNNGPLNAASATNKTFYELIRTAGTLTNADDTIINPTSATYDQTSNKVTLLFDVAQLGTPGAYRLRIGNNDPLPLAPQIINGSQAGTSLTTSQDLGTLGGAPQGLQSYLVSGTIVPQPFANIFPGGLDEPGHRNLPLDDKTESHYLADTPDVTGGVSTFTYGFPHIIGTDPLGNTLFNQITENQKQRTREIFAFWSKFLGAQFEEDTNADQVAPDFIIATGDMRAVSPTVPTGPNGGVAGIAGGGVAVMNNALTWDDRGPEPNGSGQPWFQVAMHEIGHLLGLGHSYDLPTVQIMGSTEDINAPVVPAEPVFPGDGDIVSAQHLYRPDVTDIKLYKFTVAINGKVDLETVAQRMATPSTLNTVLSLFDVNGNLIARNDDYYGLDSFLSLHLNAGQYYVGVTSVGNTHFDPHVADSGMGGTTQGPFQMRVNITPDNQVGLSSSTAVQFDGDADGAPGGTYNFWFKTQDAAHTRFVDKNAPGLHTGTLANPYADIATALAATSTGDIVRIEGNGSAGTTDASTANTLTYNIGFDLLTNPLSDGTSLQVPKGVTVMIDAGSVFKFSGANVDVGSLAQGLDRSKGALQVLGTPTQSVFFTSFNDKGLGKDPGVITTILAKGDWGGLVFRRDSDLAASGIFLDYVNHADIRYGGGNVVEGSVEEVIDPIHMVTSRPSVSFNTITNSADAAMSADPNSFEETEFQDATFTTDYSRVGPEIHDNILIRPNPNDATKPFTNKINALFVRINTLAGQSLDPLTVSARFNEKDIVYYVSENLTMSGNAGGLMLVPDPLNSKKNILQARFNARLNIDPGAVLKLSGARIDTGVGGQLIAEGTASNPIIFTSGQDRRYGAGGTFDTTNSGGQANPAPGDWGGLYFGHLAHASIDHALVTFGGGSTRIEGGFDQFNAVEIHQADVRIANSTLEHNSDGLAGTQRVGRGGNDSAVIFVRGAQPVLLNNVIRHNASANEAAISINANALNSTVIDDPGRSTGLLDRQSALLANFGPLVRGNKLEDNGVNGMLVRGATLTTQSIWDDTDIVHVLKSEIVVPNFATYGGLRLQSTGTESLVVKLSGATAGFTTSGRPLEIVDRIGGSFQAIGTPGHPVVFTSLADDTAGAGFDPEGRPEVDTNNDGSGAAAAKPAPGDWRSILLGDFSNDRNTALVNESEQGFVSGQDTNNLPNKAQFIGALAPDLKSGDDNRRLGFEVHGTISQPSDVDVYSFKGIAGTEVWLDVNRTAPSLDSVVELVDANGSVVARSNNSAAEFNVSDPMTGISPLLVGSARTMQRGDFSHRDFYSINPKDPGMRLVLPGPAGGTNTYYVRIRSAPNLALDPNMTNLAGGQTQGAYQLQVRLSETPDQPGSSVQYADIRYATNGIEVQGKPENSPLISESADSPAAHDTFATAQDLGNLLATNSNSLTVAGNLPTANTVQWYKFTMSYAATQQIPIPGAPPSPKTLFPTIFDIDHADGTGGPKTYLWIYDTGGNLIFSSKGSDVVEDRPKPNDGADTSDLSRGSSGPLDPFIGTVNLLEGANQTYYVAVSSQRQFPAEIVGPAANPLLRLEPINSLNRIVEDHVGTTGGSTAEPTQSLFNGTTVAALNAHADQWNLGDVTMFVNTPDTLFTVDPFTGTQIARVNPPNTFLPGAPGTFVYHDIAMRNDGHLETFTVGVAPGADENPLSGLFREINTGDGSLVGQYGSTGIVTSQLDNNKPPGVVGLKSGFSVEAMANQDDIFRQMWIVGKIEPTGNNTTQTKNILFETLPNGVAETPVFPEPRKDSAIPTNILPHGLLLTGPTIIPVAATDTVGSQTDQTYQVPGDIKDATKFSVTDVNGLTKNFELDSGPDVRLDPFGPMAVRDGNTFSITVGANPPKVFEFNSGPVLVVGNGSTLKDGDTFTIIDNSQPVTKTTTFEFDNNNALNNANNKAVTFTAADSVTTVVGAMLSAINGAGMTTQATASVGPYLGRITLVNDNSAVNSVTSNGPSVTISGNSTISNANNIPISFEETETAAKFLQDVKTVVLANTSSLRVGFADRAGSPLPPNQLAGLGDRISFFNASAIDLTNMKNEKLVQSFVLANDFNGQPSKTGVAAQMIQVPFDAGNTSVEMAQLIAAAINKAAVDFPQFVAHATADGASVAITGAIAPPTADLPLFTGGSGPGGQITGLAISGGLLYAVTDTGGLYRVDNPGSYQSIIQGDPDTFVPGTGPSLTYIPSAPLNGIPFSGLSVGPPNVENGHYANMLFASATDGTLHAFDTAGVPQPIFSNGKTSVNTGIGNIQGLAFSTLDTNLWHATNQRNTEPGHGLNMPLDHSRLPANPIPANVSFPTGGTSFYFGMDDPRSPLSISTQPEAGAYVPRGTPNDPTPDNTRIFNTYDMPGDAHGTLTSDSFSLKGYSASELPTLYFNYRYDAETDTFHDTFRVYASDDGATWRQLAAPGRVTLPDPNAVTNWLQARVSLAGLAGLDNIRLRFDFSTAGDTETGASATLNPGPNTVTGEIIRGVPGTKLDDGATFEIKTTSKAGALIDDHVYEIDRGYTLNMPAGAGATILNNESFTISSVGNPDKTFQFVRTGPAPPAGIVPINILATDTAADVARKVGIAVNGVIPGVTALVNTSHVNLQGVSNLTQSANAVVTVSGDANGTLTTPGAIPVPVNINMTDVQVAQLLATIFDATYSPGVPPTPLVNPTFFTSVKLDGTLIHLIGHDIIDPGPLPAIPNYPLGLLNLPGDHPNPPPPTSDRFFLNLRGQDNHHGGVYIDDFVIGLAGRGEMATTTFGAADGNSAFITNPAPPDLSIKTGHYDLQIRRGTQYGVLLATTVAPRAPYRTVLERGFDANDRLNNSITLEVPSGDRIFEGQTFTISDGVHTATFEYDSDNALTTPGSIPVPYLATDTIDDVSTNVAAAINAQTLIKVQATTRGSGTRVDLAGATAVTAPLPVPGGDSLTATEPFNDTSFGAAKSGLSTATPGLYVAEGIIGDDFAPPPNPADVDFIAVTMSPGDHLRASATTVSSDDPAVPLIVSMVLVDPFGAIVDQGLDGYSVGGSIVDFIPLVAGKYFLEVSSFSGSTGHYNLIAQLTNNRTLGQDVFKDLGDANQPRVQGYTLIDANRISNSLNFGIAVTPGTRTVNGDLPHPGSVENYVVPNIQRLVPGISIANNLITNNIQGGIQFSGDNTANSPLAAVPFGRIVNNTIYGGVTAAGTGVLVTNNASPTIINNIFANLATGVSIDATSQTTVLGANLYQGNGQNRVGFVGTEKFAITLAPSDLLFVNAAANNFYLLENSRAIDSSINSLEERNAMQTVTSPLGIPVSPILAPETDLLGQKRIADDNLDPNLPPPPPGLGSNVFKDRGAIDRVDASRPTAALRSPVDNDAAGLDKNSALNQVLLQGQTVTFFSIQLSDGSGVGIDDSTVTQAKFTFKKDGTVLVPTTDFLFSYDSTNKVVRFDAASGVFANGTYTIGIDNSQATGIKDLANNALKPNDASGVTAFTIQLTPPPTSPAQNPVNNLDVNNDGFVVGLDALIVINYLNANGTGPVPGNYVPPPYIDVNGDFLVSPLDALIVINFLNNKGKAPAAAFAPASVGGSGAAGAAASVSQQAAVSLAAGQSSGGAAPSSLQPSAAAAPAASAPAAKAAAADPVAAQAAAMAALAADAFDAHHDELESTLSDIAGDLHDAWAVKV